MTASITTCECGAKVRVPADAATRSFRCPRCKADLTVPAAAPSPPAPLPVASQAVEAGSAIVCPICQTAIAPGEDVVKCEGCDQVHHRECWTEIGGCGTYGCAKSPVVDASNQSAPQQQLSAWGDTKRCPACGETIKAIALRCRYCGTGFGTVDPLSVADLRTQVATAEKLASTKKVVVALLVVSIIGCMAPIMLAVNLVFVYRNREQLAKCGPLFVIMGWAAVILSAFYSLAIVAFLLGDSMRR